MQRVRGACVSARKLGHSALSTCRSIDRHRVANPTDTGVPGRRERPNHMSVSAQRPPVRSADRAVSIPPGGLGDQHAVRSREEGPETVGGIEPRLGGATTQHTRVPEGEGRSARRGRWLTSSNHAVT